MSVHTNTMPEQPAPKAFNLRLAALWRWLTEPHEGIQDPEQRRRVRFLLTLTSIMVPLAPVGVLVSHFLTTPTLSLAQSRVFLIAVGISVLLAVANALARTEKYHAMGAAIALAATSLGTMLAAASEPQQATTLLTYVTVAVLLGSLLLPLTGIIILAVVNGIALALLPILAPAIPAEATTNILLFDLIMSSLIVVSAAIRQQDLERIERQAQELAEAVRQAEEANRLKSQFLATMSHELRTPLNAIIGFAEVMLMGLAGELAPETRHTTSRIHHNSERLLQLIDDLLDISKIEAGRMEIVRRPFEPVGLLAEIERVMKHEAIEKGLRFETELDPGLPDTLIGDQQRLERILLNLVSNAVKFTDKGNVKISLRRDGQDAWTMEVTDTGIGIPIHAQEYIFEKFRQVDGTSRRAYTGAGLGLAIVRDLTLLMDGNVNVRSKPGIGSTFTVTLPLVLPEGARIR